MARMPRFGTLLGGIMAVAMLVSPLVGYSARFDIIPALTVREIYTDNINLDPPGQESDKFITEITPQIEIRNRGEPGKGRIDLRVDYRMQTFAAQSNTVPKTVNHQLQATATVEVAKRNLFVDLRSTISQENITNTGTVSDNNVNNTGNRTTAYTWTVSPYLRNHFGPYVDTEVRYTTDDLTYSSISNDTSSDEVLITADSGRRFSGNPWNVFARYRRLENQDGSTSKFRRVEGQLNYNFNRQFTPFVRLGYDDDDLVSTATDTSGTFWQVGTVWRPTPRSDIDVGYGERYFGDFVRLDARHTSRRTTWRVRFDEDTTTSSIQQQERNLLPVTDAAGNPIRDPQTDQPIFTDISAPTISNEVFVSRRMRGIVSFQGRRTRGDWDVYGNRRQFQTQGGTEKVYGTTLRGNRELTRRAFLDIDGLYQRTEFQDSIREDDRWRARARYRYEFSDKVTGELVYQYTRNDSNDSSSEFRENRIEAAIRVRFSER